MEPTIVLIGPPGSGKSSVGRILAKKLNLPLIDTDSLIEIDQKKKIGDIFLDNGEEYFREKESEIVGKALTSQSGIISLGGGAILRAETRAALQRIKNRIFLDVSISNAAPRVGFNRDRPLLMANPRQQWIALMAARRPIYENLATLTVLTDNKKPDAVAKEIISLLGITVSQ